MKDATISAADLQALLDVAEGYTTENGLDAVARYAVPEEVQQAISNASAEMRSRMLFSKGDRHSSLPPQ